GDRGRVVLDEEEALFVGRDAESPEGSGEGARVETGLATFLVQPPGLAAVKFVTVRWRPREGQLEEVKNGRATPLAVVGGVDPDAGAGRRAAAFSDGPGDVVPPCLLAEIGGHLAIVFAVPVETEKLRLCEDDHGSLPPRSGGPPPRQPTEFSADTASPLAL